MNLRIHRSDFLDPGRIDLLRRQDAGLCDQRPLQSVPFSKRHLRKIAGAHRLLCCVGKLRIGVPAVLIQDQIHILLSHFYNRSIPFSWHVFTMSSGHTLT